MKFKFLRIAAIATVAMSLGSCVEEEVIGDDFSRQQKISVEMPDFEDDQSSRSCVDVKSNNTSSTSFLWQPNDKIGVYSKDGASKNVPFTNTSKKNITHILSVCGFVVVNYLNFLFLAASDFFLRLTLGFS